MRKVVCQSFVSLDGVVTHLDRWHFAYVDEESNAIALEQLRDSGALLMGRRTYEVYAAAWPDRHGDYPDLINRKPKHVVSSTLGEAHWENTTVLSGAPIAAIRKLKEVDGQQVLMHGFGSLARQLLCRPRQSVAGFPTGRGRRRRCRPAGGRSPVNWRRSVGKPGRRPFRRPPRRHFDAGAR